MESLSEGLSWLVLEHFKDYDAWPWARFNSVEKQLEEHASFVVGEVLFLALACLAVYHAFRADESEARRLKLCLFASLLAGTANDYIFMVLPVVDNFFQAQAVIMLTPRMPLYIPCVYIAFMYWSSVASARIFCYNRASPLAEASLAGMLAGILYAPYDLCGARFLWWTWHDSDPAIQERWLGVPAGSTAWTITFTFCFVWLLRTAALKQMSKLQSLARACLSTPLMIVVLNVFTVLGGDSIGRPGCGTVLASLIAFGLIVLRELLRPRSEYLAPESDAKQLRAHFQEPLSARIGLVTYFVTVACVMAVFSPEKQISTGVHQTFGPCDATDIDLMGYQRNRFICKERFPGWYFGFDCPSNSRAEGRWERVSAPATREETITWYTVCGQPHEDFQTWMGATVALTSLGAVLFTLSFLTTAPPLEAKIAGQAGKRKQLTQLGKRIQSVLDPLIVPLAEKHWNVAVTLLTVLFVGLTFLGGALLSVVYPGGNPGTYLQKPYDLMKQLPFANKPYFMFLAAGMADFLVVALYLSLDFWRPPFVQKMIQQKRAAGNWDHGFVRTVKQACQCFIFSASCLVYQEIRSGPSLYTKPWMPTCLDSCEIELPELAPSLTEFVIHFAACLVIFDFSYWYIHWQMHRHRMLYKKIHSIHHEYKEPFVTVGSHVHPVEFNLVFILAMAAPAACGAHPFTAVVFQMVQTWMGMEDHTGWEQTALGWVMDKLTLGNFPGSMGHNIHHAVISGNYQPYLGYLDGLCGLDVELDTQPSVGEAKAVLKADSETDQKSLEDTSQRLVHKTSLPEGPAPSSEIRRRTRTETPPPTPRT